MKTFRFNGQKLLLVQVWRCLLWLRTLTIILKVFYFTKLPKLLTIFFYPTAYNLQQYSQPGVSPSQVANTTYPVPMVSNTFTRETITGGPSNAWTVEEQIYKSKMWLQQRNQSMLPKPWCVFLSISIIFIYSRHCMMW